MSDKSPIFPIPDPQHLDHGFHNFQVMEDARKLRRETAPSSLDLRTFKLQKPIAKPDFFRKIRMNKKRCLRNALLCFKLLPRRPVEPVSRRPTGSICSPVYSTESRRAASIRPGSGPMEIPYVSLRERNCRVSAPIYLVT